MHRDVRPNPLLESLLGIRDIPQRLLVSVSLSEEYSDNFFAEESTSEREEEYRTSLNIGTVYRTELGRGFVSLANTLRGDYDLRSDVINVGFANLSLNTGYQLPRLSLALSESFIRSDDIAEASPTGIRRGRRKFLTNSVTPQLRYDLSQTTAATLAYTNTYSHDEGDEQGDADTFVGTEGQDGEDSIAHSFTTALRHRFTPVFNGLASYSFTTSHGGDTDDRMVHAPLIELDYRLGALTTTIFQAFTTLTERNEGGVDSQIYGFSVGVRRQLSPFLTAFGSLGPLLFDREDRGPRLYATWQVGLDGTLPITRRTTLSFSSQGGIDDTAGQADDVGLVLGQSAGVTLDHRVSRDLLASLFINYARTELLEDPGTSEFVEGEKDNFWTAGTRLTYALTRALTLSLGYRYQRRDSNVQDADYDENRITISLSTAFRVF
jgi:hypothetical protein